MNINELKVVIAELVEEAKKKKEIKAKENQGRAKNAFGSYSEALDFSWPLGQNNLYRQQGGANWGPSTSEGPKVDQNFSNPNIRLQIKEEDEKTIRSIVREVLDFGLVPSNSAWSPMIESSKPRNFDSPWEQAMNEAAHWYMQHTETNGHPEAGPKKKTKIEKTKYGKVVKHGPPDNLGGKNKRLK